MTIKLLINVIPYEDDTRYKRVTYEQVKKACGKRSCGKCGGERLATGRTGTGRNRTRRAVRNARSTLVRNCRWKLKTP